MAWLMFRFLNGMVNVQISVWHGLCSDFYMVWLMFRFLYGVANVQISVWHG